MSAVPKDVRTMLLSQLQVVQVPSRVDTEQDAGKQKIMKAFILDRYQL
jgi:hypothetical protein